MPSGAIAVGAAGTRIISNFEARKIVLASAEIKRIEDLEKGMRLVNGDWCPVWDV